MAISFTREQLRNFVTNSANFTAQDYTFTLINNTSTTAGFSMEGGQYYVSESGVFVGYKYRDIFNSASITSLANCSLVSGSSNVAFLIDSGSTATFTFTPTATLLKEEVKMLAPNSLVYSVGDITASGSYFGTDLDISP